jgi:uncharacterized protein
MQNPIIFLGVFSALAYGISWAIWQTGIKRLALNSLNDERFGIYLFWGSFGPTFAALIVTMWQGGLPALGTLLSRVIQVNVHWGVYLFVFLALPAFGILMFVLAGVPTKIPLWQIAITMLPLAPLNALVGGIILGNGPLGEEMGWRGILQETLGRDMHPALVAVLIGLVWSLWHAPLFRFNDFRAGLNLPLFVPLYTLSLVLIAFTMGHLWNWSGGSLFVAIFFHAMLNITAAKLSDAAWWNFERFSSLHIYLLVLGAFALTAILAETLNRMGVFSK